MGDATISTATITLQPQNISASVQYLKAEFTKSKLSGVKTLARKGTIPVQMPIAHLADLVFAYAPEAVLWEDAEQQDIVAGLKRFIVEQQARDKTVGNWFESP